MLDLDFENESYSPETTDLRAKMRINLKMDLG